MDGRSLDLDGRHFCLRRAGRVLRSERNTYCWRRTEAVEACLYTFYCHPSYEADPGSVDNGCQLSAQQPTGEATPFVLSRMTEQAERRSLNILLYSLPFVHIGSLRAFEADAFSVFLPSLCPFSIVPSSLFTTRLKFETYSTFAFFLSQLDRYSSST